MKKERSRKKHSMIKYVICTLLLIGCIAVGIYSHFGGFGTGKCADTEEFAKYATSVEGITIPEDTQIVALGEATHGNVEFQQLKLDVFQILVEKYGIRAFALEGDYGGCETVNRYIHGGDGTADDAASAIGFAIYRTKEMADLISWMRTYNETAEAGQDLCFYGFDMQRYAYNFKYLLEAAKNSNVNTEKLEQIWDKEKNEYIETYSSEQRAEIIKSIKEELTKEDEQKNAQAIHFADILLQNMELGRNMDDAVALRGIRDQMMLDNVMWILNQEETRGNHCIFISGHNGHVKRYGCYDSEYKYMGNLLADKLKDKYFVIGTDFYKSKCNLPKGSDGKRINHTFYSYDPVAKASEKCGYDMSYLNFSKIPDDSKLKSQVTEYTWMGSVGESYNPLYLILPVTYREWSSPTESYDAMIYVAYAHPTEVRKNK
jgi:erythromycin esterase